MLQEDATKLITIATQRGGMIIGKDMAEIIRKLWQDPGVQECVSRAREYQLNDSAI